MDFRQKWSRIPPGEKDKRIDTLYSHRYNGRACEHKAKFRFVSMAEKEVPGEDENDLPAKKKAAKKGTRFPKKDENEKRPKCTKAKKSKRKKSRISIRTAKVVFLL